MKIAYLKCLCTTKDRLLAKKLREQGYVIRIVRGHPDIRKEAMSYQRMPPFIVERGMSRPV